METEAEVEGGGLRFEGSLATRRGRKALRRLKPEPRQVTLMMTRRGAR